MPCSYGTLAQDESITQRIIGINQKFVTADDVRAAFDLRDNSLVLPKGGGTQNTPGESGADDALYDKWLIQRLGYSPVQVQVWYVLYITVIFTLYFAVLWWPQRKRSTPFVWRWTIPLIGILLFLADFVYFIALSNPDALIVILSILRRCSVLVSFFAGAFLFKEVNKGKKAWVLLGILVGVLLIILAG